MFFAFLFFDFPPSIQLRNKCPSQVDCSLRDGPLEGQLILSSEDNDHPEDDSILEHGGDDEAHAAEEPDLEGGDCLATGNETDAGVEHVDDHEAEGEEEANSGGIGIRRDDEGDPAHDDKHGGGKVDGEHKRTQRSVVGDLESINAVVMRGSHKCSSVLLDGADVDIKGKGPLVLAIVLEGPGEFYATIIVSEAGEEKVTLVLVHGIVGVFHPVAHDGDVSPDLVAKMFARRDLQGSDLIDHDWFVKSDHVVDNHVRIPELLDGGCAHVVVTFAPIHTLVQNHSWLRPLDLIGQADR